MTTPACREQDRPFAAQRARAAVVLAAAGTLAWSGAHWMSLRLADPHGHLHDHGVDHTGPDGGQQQLDALHAFLGPTALVSALVLAVALVGLRGNAGAAGAALGARAVAITAGVSAAAFVLVETAEHAATSSSAPPVALLTIGTAVHALAGAAAAVLSAAALRSAGHRPQAVTIPSRPARARPPERTWRPLPRALLAVLAGRAPPVCTTTPQPSS